MTTIELANGGIKAAVGDEPNTDQVRLTLQLKGAAPTDYAALVVMSKDEAERLGMALLGKAAQR